MASWGSGRTGRVVGRSRVSRLQPNDSEMHRGISVRVFVIQMLKARQPPSVRRFGGPGSFARMIATSTPAARRAVPAIAAGDHEGPMARPDAFDHTSVSVRSAAPQHAHDQGLGSLLRCSESQPRTPT